MRIDIRSRGFTLIELVIYAGVTSVMLSVWYQLFALGGVQKVRDIVEDSLVINADTAFYELTRTVQGATSVTVPAAGASSPVLQLDAGAVVYQVDANGILTRTEGGQTAAVTNDNVVVDQVAFTHLGPSSESPTVVVELTLSGRHLLEGKQRTEMYRTGISLR
ncbi:MAG TPA: prepilin-type N-terminal cleavage/methylation domain-containing protein [Patescibacteria group bacterium]|nr:prepilin-type N-terminal cleavage/methylation domain-containing protein [Patescibacteria group bacterium]